MNSRKTLRTQPSRKGLQTLRQRSTKIIRSSRKILGNESICLCISFFVTLSLFMGLFFGLVYPEYLLTKYIPTECYLVSTDVVARYKCGKSCPGCSQSPPDIPTCDSKIKEFELKDPEKCSSKAVNGTGPEHCAISGSECQNGYECCATVCSTCTSCSSSKYGTSCRSYVCNCYCARSVSREYCTVDCYQAYSGKLDLLFNKNDGGEQLSSYLKDFDRDIEGAQNFITNYLVSESFTCYYNPNDPSEILIDGDFFTDWKLYLTGFLGILPLFTVLVILTHISFRNIVDRNQMDEDLHFYINWWLWIGIILPLVIALPIRDYGYRVNQNSWSITIAVLLVLGNLPLLSIGFYYLWLWFVEYYKTKQIPRAIPLNNPFRREVQEAEVVDEVEDHKLFDT